jgi:DNA-binding beta-propeller fold protein YncE
MTFTVTDTATMQAQTPLDLRIAKPLALFVSDFSTPSGAVDMFDNASVADGASAWTRQLKGSVTTLDNAVGGPPAGVSYDAARNILYVARFQGSDNGAVLAFHNADTVDGNAAPNRIIQAIVPTSLSLNSPSDVFIDSGNDRIYIADVTGSSGVIFILDSASVAPTLRKGFSFLPGPPAAISVDIGRDILYVVPSQGQEIIAYDNISELSSSQRTITIGSTAGVGLVDVKIDPATDTAYAADYDGGRVLVINNVSQKNGTYAPDRTLTGLTNPNSVFPDVANDRLFVSNRDGATSYSVGVVEEMSSVDGPVSFSRELSGFGTAAGMTGYYK